MSGKSLPYICDSRQHEGKRIYGFTLHYMQYIMKRHDVETKDKFD